MAAALSRDIASNNNLGSILIDEGLYERAITVLTSNLQTLKDQYDIGLRYRSCHTGVSKDGYVFEGHIPAKLVQRFLADPPEGAIGLAVPGMPVGSPGMEVGDKFMAYQVLLLMKDGSVKVYETVSSKDSQY